jgi:tRNA U34 5-methylaminomethyl-2-thiouridine-forming methyltransferase MnmC
MLASHGARNTTMTACLPAPDAGPAGCARVAWREGTPVSPRFGEGYFGSADALAESRHVFLAGNGLPKRFAPGFSVAELGFGTGLNAIVAADAWRRAGLSGALAYTAFELAPIAAADMARALSPWPEIAPLAASLVAAWGEGRRRIALPGLALRVIEGDTRETLPAWTGQADAWFLDGFSPARNPELWEPALLSSVARHTRPGGTFATFTAAGAVRRALGDAGFAVERVPGHGRKRHMTRGRLAGR